MWTAPWLQEFVRVNPIACDDMSGLLSRSHMTAAKMGSATRGPNNQTASFANGSHGLCRVLGSIDHSHLLEQARPPAYVDGPLVARVCSCESDRLRSYVRSVVAVAHDRCQDGFRDARSKQPNGVFCQWVPRIVSRLGIDRSHSSTRASAASGMLGQPP